MKILAIGNSFSEDATAYLYQMARAQGINLEVVNLYVGGCSLKQHWENVEHNAIAYIYQRNGMEVKGLSSIEQALNQGPWDVITLQQASHDSGEIESYEPYFRNLLYYLKDRGQGAALYLHQTWAYERDCEHSEFYRYDYKQEKMFEALEMAYNMIKETYQLPMIPCGTVIQNLRKLPEFKYENGGHSLCRDGFHISIPYGRYALAATWLQVLTGADIMKNSFVPEGENLDYTLLQIIKKVVFSQK